MHIVFYISRLGVGGVQTFVIQLAKELIKMPNVSVSIFCHYPELIDAHLNEALPKEIKVVTLTKNVFLIKVINKLRNILKKVHRNFDLKEYLTTKHFLRTLKKEKTTLVHANTDVGNTNENCCLAQEKMGIPYLITLHGTYTHLLNQELSKEEHQAFKIIFERVLATAGTLVYLSEKNLLPFELIFGNRAFLKKRKFIKINNGLTAQYPLSKEDKDRKKLVFGMIARGSPDKGWLELLEVFDALVKEGHQDMELVLFASGNYVGDLMASRTWVPNIKYKGITASPIEEIRQFDVGILPSYAIYEEMPFTIIEYLSVAKPCIATDIGAIAEMLRSEKDQFAGILLPLGEDKKTSKTHLKAALLKFIEDRSYLDFYGNEAQKAFKKFDIKNTTKEYHKVYKEILSKKG
jgi:glycosyltransferase involved in cell wall biosynthesis